MSDTTNDCTTSRDTVIATRMREDDSDGSERNDRRLPSEPPRQHEAAPRTKDTAMALSASERISKLLEELRPQRKALLAIIDFCREERSSSQIDEMLAPLLVWRQSVYTNVNLRSMLESAGALTWHANDDAPEYELDECGALVIPSAVNNVVGTWTATPAGIAALEAADPFGELVNALEQDASNTNAYVRILRLCADNARSITDINAAMGDSALDAVALVGKLEDVEAIEWRGGWATTDLGMRYLDRVA